MEWGGGGERGHGVERGRGEGKRGERRGEGKWSGEGEGRGGSGRGRGEGEWSGEGGREERGEERGSGRGRGEGEWSGEGVRYTVPDVTRGERSAAYLPPSWSGWAGRWRRRSCRSASIRGPSLRSHSAPPTPSASNWSPTVGGVAIPRATHGGLCWRCSRGTAGCEAGSTYTQGCSGDVSMREKALAGTAGQWFRLA